MTKVINLYGGPCSAKSTTAAGLFHRMKQRHMSVELVTEYAKELVYSNRLEHMTDQQEYIFAEQNARIHRLRDKVDYVITDSPILLSAIYANADWCCVDRFKNLVYCCYASYNNIDIFLRRPNIFDNNGRLHNEEQSKELDSIILTALKQQKSSYMEVQVDDNTLDTILNIIIKDKK